MPATNKEMFRRLMAIDEMLSNGLYSTEEIRIRLKEKGMSVTARTVQNDLKVIKEDFGIPFLPNTGNKHTYEDPQKRIFQKELSEVEREVLSSALQALGKFKGIPQLEEFDRFKSTFGVKGDGRTIIEFSNMFDLGTDSEQIMPHLFQAIHDKRTIRLTYQAFTDKKPKKIDVFPYLLKEYLDRWYLICAEVGTEPLRYVTKGVDRIKDFNYLDKTSYPYKDANIDFRDYFDEFIGVTDFNNAAVDVVLCVNPEHQIDQYLRSKPLHSSQAEVKGEELEAMKKKYELFKDWTFFKLKGIKPNNELYQTLVLYLGDLVVLEPVTVRNKLAKRLRNLLSLYDQIKK